MDLSLTDEQVALQDTIRSMLDDRFATTELRACEADPEKARAIYDQLAELGIGGIIIPEASGGLGMGLGDLVVAQAEMGRALVPLLFTETTVTSATLLAASGGESAASILSEILSGTAYVCCAAINETVPCCVSGSGDKLVMSGELALVPELALANYIIAKAVDSDGTTAICALRTNAAGMTVTDLSNLADLPIAKVALDMVPVVALIADGQAADAAWNMAQDRMKVAIAAQAVGGAGRVLEIASEYASTRKQFGQPIGSFQAIAHMLADAAVNLEGARILTFRAAAAADDGENFSTWADMAKLKATQTFRDTSATAIQVHGGIGFTLEADPQLYYRRAKHLQLMYGEPLDLRERAGKALLSAAHRVLEG